MRRVAWFGGTEFDPLEFEDIDNGNRPHSEFTPVPNPLKSKLEDSGQETESLTELPAMKKYQSDSKISMRKSDYALGKTRDISKSNDQNLLSND